MFYAFFFSYIASYKMLVFSKMTTHYLLDQNTVNDDNSNEHYFTWNSKKKDGMNSWELLCDVCLY